MRRTNFPAEHQGNLDAADGKGGSHRIKKTSGKSQGTLRVCLRPLAGWECRVVGHPNCQRKNPAANKVESHLRFPEEEIMPKKPTVDDARLILQLYDLRREPELRKARQWWVITFWPKNADDFVKVATTMGSQENNWLRQVGSYWGIAVSFVSNGVVSEKLFFQLSFCGEMYVIFAKVRPFLTELGQKMNNPGLFLTMEKALMSAQLARAQLVQVESRG